MKGKMAILAFPEETPADWVALFFAGLFGLILVGNEEAEIEMCGMCGGGR